MKTNPGGEIGPKEVVGRNDLIDSLWETLARQSVILTAERRIGKTSIIRKMQAEPREGWIPIYRDLEKCHSASEFAIVVYNDVKQFLGRWTKAANSARQFIESVGGTEVAGVITLPEIAKRQWKSILENAVRDLQEANVDKQCLFFWDEVPYMLDSIRRTSESGEKTAMQVLDVLRSLRQHHSKFRMVLTGSIGLHHVIADIQDAGYSNTPLNDMYSVEVTPLTRADAKYLVAELIKGEGIVCPDIDAAASTCAGITDYVPFYIHHIIRLLKNDKLPAEPDQLEEAINRQLTDSNDPWELAHYRTRISTYYPDHQTVVFAILDTLAVSAKPMTADKILEAVKASVEFDDRNRLLDLLKLMDRDHYLVRNAGSDWSWRFPLVKRWWILDREL